MRKKPKTIREKLKDKMVNDIWRLLETKKEERKKKKQNQKIVEDNLIRDIKLLFE